MDIISIEQLKSELSSYKNPDMGMSDMTGHLDIGSLEPDDEEYVLRELNRVYCLQKLLSLGIIEEDDPKICDSNNIVIRWENYDCSLDMDIESYIDGDRKFDIVPQ